VIAGGGEGLQARAGCERLLERRLRGAVGVIAHGAQPPDSPPELVFVGFTVLGVLEGLAVARCSRA